MKLNKISVLTMTILVTACGGGGGSGAAPAPDKPGDKPANTQKPTAEQASWVSGLYDGSTKEGQNDETYYEIDDEGTIHTYDYMNDAVDSAGNCYQPVPAGSAKVNGILEGLQLYWDEEKNGFATKTIAGTLFIAISPANKQITSISMNGISGSKILTFSSSDYSISLRAEQTAKRSLEDIKSMMCDG